MLGLLYDVHGNLPALEAVLADAEAAGANRYVLGGDYAAFGGWPKETVERLRELDAAWIRGNTDRWLISADDAPEVALPAIERCRALLGDDLAAELAALPETHRHGSALFCHASAGSDMVSFMPEPAENEDELLQGVESEYLVFGHTHLAFSRQSAGGITLVNPGSVGMPFDGDPRAAYVVVADDGSFEQHRVEYDHMASAAGIREVLGEAGELPAKRVEQARFDPV